MHLVRSKLTAENFSAAKLVAKVVKSKVASCQVMDMVHKTNLVHMRTF